MPRTLLRSREGRWSRRLRIARAPLVGSLLLLGLPAMAAEIEVALSSRVSFGDTVRLTVGVVDPGEDMSRPSLSPVPGLRIAGPRGPEVRIERQGIGGRITTRTTHLYQFFIEPEEGRTGTFQIGPVRIRRQGQPDLTSGTVALAVYRKPGIGARLECEVSPPSGIVGAACRVEYRLLYHYEYPGGRRRLDLSSILSSLHLPVLEHADLIVKPIASKPREEAFKATLGERPIIYQEGFAALPDGTAYDTFTFAFEVIPRKVGRVELGRARAELLLPTGQVERVRVGLFLENRPTRRQVSSVSPSVVYEARELPLEGRPPGFTGAVGRYRVTARTSDTHVKAFDPIEIEVVVRGDGLLEDLEPPDWHQVEALTARFRVSPDVHAGEVVEGTKVFRQVIRALHEGVREIPPIPFPYYDPWDGKYKSAYSDPIPIRVDPAETVGAEAAIGKNGAANGAGETSGAPAPAAVVEASGIRRNFPEIGELLPEMNSRRSVLEPPFLISFAAPPLLFAGLLVLRRLRRRDPAAIAHRRALGTAREALARSGDDIEAVSTAFQEYFRVRFRLADGEITPEQLLGELESRAIDAALARKSAGLLEVLLAGRFGGSRHSARELATQAAELLQEIHRCRV